MFARIVFGYRVQDANVDRRSTWRHANHISGLTPVRNGEIVKGIVALRALNTHSNPDRIGVGDLVPGAQISKDPGPYPAPRCRVLRACCLANLHYRTWDNARSAESQSHIETQLEEFLGCVPPV